MKATSTGYLGHLDWHSLARVANKSSSCEIDLRDVRVVYPPGSVALLLASRYRHDLGFETIIRCPENPDVLNYLERIDFFRKAKEYVCFEPDVESLARNRRNPSNKLTELLTPSEAGFPEVLDVVAAFLREHSPAQARSTYSALDELLCNIDDHSAPGFDAAYSCAQIQVFREAVELALGDLGIGILNSLSRNTSLPPLASDAAALNGALIHRYSRLANNRTRGGGLRRAADVIIQRGGEFRVRSYRGHAYNRRGSSQLRFEDVSGSFPGTIVSVRIPRS